MKMEKEPKALLTETKSEHKRFDSRELNEANYQEQTS